jgi:hypothetical protein
MFVSEHTVFDVGINMIQVIVKMIIEQSSLNTCHFIYKMQVNIGM